MGTKWCCSGFREPESKVYADPDADPGLLTDVRRFVEESSLTSEAEAEMEPVADTFRGVENLDAVFNWEGPEGSPANPKPQNEWRHLNKHVENYEKDHTIRADANPEWVHSSADGWVKQSEEPQRKRFLSFFWKVLPPKTSNKNAVELIEFARDLGNEDCTTPQASAVM